MERIDTPNATNAGQFQDANPSSGLKATEFSAAWCNQVQEEIATPIEASGRALDASKTNQLMMSIIDLTYGIGDYIYTENDNITPGQRFPWQTWAEVTGVALVGRDTSQIEFNTTGKTGGEKTHILTQAELPAVTFTVAGGGRIDAQGSENAGGAFAGLPGAGNVSAMSMTVGPLGSGTGHNNLQPYRVVRMWRRTA